jgi:hypothetical protein
MYSEQDANGGTKLEGKISRHRFSRVYRGFFASPEKITGKYLD